MWERVGARRMARKTPHRSYLDRRRGGDDCDGDDGDDDDGDDGDDGDDDVQGGGGHIDHIWTGGERLSHASSPATSFALCHPPS